MFLTFRSSQPRKYNLILIPIQLIPVKVTQKAKIARPANAF
jgi:hypothetical protein